MIPYFRFKKNKNEIGYINKVINSGWLTTGKFANKFANDFSKILGKKYALPLNSCTSALHLALKITGIKKGDYVLVPSMTFVATAEIIEYEGAIPIFLDVDYNSSLITPEILQRAIKKYQKKIKALFIVHFAGISADMIKIKKICKKYNIKILEDCAHAFPSIYNKRHVGAYGDVSCFSFYANKTITTGEGGMLVTNNIKMYKKAKILSLHGMSSDIHKRSYSDAGWEYDIIEQGYKYNMPDLNAALGYSQLKYYKEMHRKRIKISKLYYKKLKYLDKIQLPYYSDKIENHSWHLFQIKLKNKNINFKRKFIDNCRKDGVRMSVHYKPVHLLKYYKKKYNLKSNSLKNTHKLWSETVSLPIYPDLSENAVNKICRVIKKNL